MGADSAARQNGFSWKHTAVGALTHQAARALWAYGFKRLFASRRQNVAMAKGSSASRRHECACLRG